MISIQISVKTKVKTSKSKNAGGKNIMQETTYGADFYIFQSEIQCMDAIY